ncbi:hypothetical protein FRC17_010039 [Serendipita sp. 399]|nr:hypothetical protein FRC17_010039 [Serendipita sp. 399]
MKYIQEPHIEQEQISKGKVDAVTPLILTPIPIQGLKNEIDIMDMFGPYSKSLEYIIFLELALDRGSESLRATFLPFSKLMCNIAEKINVGLHLALAFYENGLDFGPYNSSQDSYPRVVTDDMIRMLWDTRWQSRARRWARDALKMMQYISKTFREKVLPMIPILEQALSAFISQYTTRYSPSISFPKLVADFIASISANQAPVPLEYIQRLAFDFQQIKILLQQLPSFFDNLFLHYARLLLISQPCDIVSLGYSSWDDYRQLFMDRMDCCRMLKYIWAHMRDYFYPYEIYFE